MVNIILASSSICLIFPRAIVKFIITWNLIKPSFLINLDYFLVFLISFSCYFSYFYRFSVLPSASVSFRQPTSRSKKKYHNKNQDICTHSPQYSRWHKVYILIYLIYNKTLDGTMVNIILASITIWPNFFQEPSWYL